MNCIQVSRFDDNAFKNSWIIILMDHGFDCTDVKDQVKPQILRDAKDLYGTEALRDAKDLHGTQPLRIARDQQDGYVSQSSRKLR